MFGWRNEMIIKYADCEPEIAGNVFIAPTAFVAGDVTIDRNVTIWPGASVRGDINSVTIGSGTNIQDNASVHVGHDEDHSVHIGENVTIGHNAVVHGARIGDNALIGMGAIVLDGAVIGEGAMIAAGSLVTPGTFIAPGTLAVGSPARVRRDLSQEEKESIMAGCVSYQALAGEYSRACGVESR